ncbi:MAG: HAD family phosphatase [Cyclobacteriaceae bacterium]|nr:HAD family phosphatase [Cyclobacteriaceae bacterium]
MGRNIEAIIFDAEGVVVDTEKLWDDSQDILLGNRGLIYDRDYLKPRMAGQTLLDGATLMVEYYGLTEKPESIAYERHEIIHDLFEKEISFIRGFQKFMEWLQTTTFQYAIATAMNKSLMEKVERRLGLQRFFGAHIYYIEDVGNKSKPAPDVFLLAAERLGVDPENCLVIEDAPHGIEAASRAGMLSAGIVTTFNRELLQKADFVADDFNEIREFISKSKGVKQVNF